MKWSRKTRKILYYNTYSLLLYAFLVLFCFFNRNRILQLSFFCSCRYLSPFLISSTYQILKSRKGAKKVYSQKGIYHVKLTEKGQIIVGNKFISIAGDTNARAIETTASYILRPDSQHTFCIPKRVMSIQEQKETEKIFTHLL